MITKYSQIRAYLPYIAFCGGIITLSMAFLPVSTLGFELPKLLVLSIIGLGCSASLFLQKRDVLSRFTATVPGIFFLAFGMVIMLSLLWSVAPSVSLLGASPRFQGVLVHLLYLIVALWVADRMSSARWKAVCVAAFLSANGIVVLYGIVQMVSLDPLAHLWKDEAFLGRIFSGLGHPNTLGQFILLTVPFVTLHWLHAEERIQKMGWAMVLIGNAVVLLGTVSRSALLGALVLLCFCIQPLRQQMKRKVASISAEQGFVLSLIVVLCATVGLLFFAQRFSQTFASGRSISSREVMWQSTLSMVAARPLGWGLETMAFTSPQFTGKELYNYESLTTTVDRAHNEPLHVLLTLGPLGFLAYIGFVFTLLSSVWRCRSRDPTGLLRAAAAGILGFQIAVFFGFPSVATAALFWMIAGMLLGLIPQTREPLALRWERTVAVCFLVISVAVFVLAVRWTQARWMHAHARQENSLLAHQQGILMFPHDRQSLIEVAQVHLLAFDASNQRYHSDLTHSTNTLIDLLEKNTNHRDGMADLLRAWLAATQGDRTNAEAHLAAAKTLLPTSFVFHRTALHIAEKFEDGVLAEHHRMHIRGLLPDGYFVEGSQQRRILLKQHPWLENL